jgi:hypothetical protein
MTDRYAKQVCAEEPNGEGQRDLRRRPAKFLLQRRNEQRKRVKKNAKRQDLADGHSKNDHIIAESWRPGGRSGIHEFNIGRQQAFLICAFA